MAAKTPNPPIGSVFGRLTVMSDFHTKGNDRSATCRCSCGTVKTVSKGNLINKNVQSCGCLSIEASKKRGTTHGMSRKPIYSVWSSIIQRCQNPSHIRYADYGGRDIKVSEDWQTFEGFFKDMGNPPFEGATLERVDTNGNYEKSNAVWADCKTQGNNRRNNVLFEYKGEKYSLDALSKLSGLNVKTMSSRIHTNKWSVKDAVELPLHTRASSKVNVFEGHKLYPQP